MRSLPAVPNRVRLALAALALVALYAALTGFHQPPTAPPAVAEIDRPLYNRGSTCLAAVLKHLNAITAASRAGSLAAYRAASVRLEAAGASCKTKIGNATARSQQGSCAKGFMVSAFDRYRQSGSFFRQAADASQNGNSSGAHNLAVKAAAKARAGDGLLTKADGVLRGTRACPV